MVKQALRVGMVTVGVAAVWPAALAWAPTATPAPGIVLADAARVEPTATAHPPVPRDLASLWLVPDARPVPPLLLKNFTRGIELVEAESFDEARPLLAAPALAKTPVADYARYYTALIDLRRGEAVRAREAFHAIVATQPAGVLGEWALVGEAMAAEQSSDFPAAAALYETLSKNKPEEPDAVLLGLARTLTASGNRDRALQVYRDLYYGYPLSDVAGDARTQMIALGAATARDDARELARAEQLFTARRYADAQTAFETVPPRNGDERELVALRIAECHHYLGRHRQAIAALQPYLSGAKREAEARFFHLTATRALGDQASYVAAAKALVTEFKTGAWTEETLNNLATHYIVTDDDATAGTVFTDYLERFPQGKYGPRAAWRLGWWKYRAGDFDGTATIFDQAAVNFPRSDYRPSWLYWSGRAYAKVNQTARANARFELVRTDYLHSYYGRLAGVHLGAAATSRSPVGAMTAAKTDATPPPGLPPNASAIRQLILSGSYPLAEAEVKYAQRRNAPTPALEATRAWLLRARGEYRPAINAMKRAYPQYMTLDGDQLPLDAKRVIFPLDYWPIIERHANARSLDPYLIAALVAQESSFDPDVRSAANAYGLMQIVPATGKRLARSLGIRKFSTGNLTDPETNVKLGTFYFKGLVNQFGGAHFALASYNAGENRVERWIAERGPLPQDEFIDDIPFPETQLYVKKILGTAEDYRQLYGDRRANAN
ncbi:MAG: transglycosylase SLT domain-containing protein [Vicinamibacteraceae bacterium]